MFLKFLSIEDFCKNFCDKLIKCDCSKIKKIIECSFDLYKRKYNEDITHYLILLDLQDNYIYLIINKKIATIIADYDVYKKLIDYYYDCENDEKFFFDVQGWLLIED